MYFGYGLPKLGSLIPEDTAEIVKSGQCGDDVFYTLDSNGLLTISGTGEMWDYDSNNISPFHSKKSVKDVIIKNGVISIGNDAFESCSNLKSIKISDSVTSIGESAFKDCSSLKNIEISESIISIGIYTFYGCSSLKSITIPDSVTSIGIGAFSNCLSLKEIKISDNNKNYIDIDGVLFNKSCTELLLYPAGKDDLTYSIPDSVTNIESCAFYGCSSLESIEIPESVMIIGIYTFDGCSSLKSIEIPESVKIIGYYAFKGCSDFESITILNPECEISNYSDTISSTATIYGFKGSTAEEYAKTYDRKFIALD